jgi:diguanylate cyclase (GGDEF)-like protein/PAS domain S-box-containing protein
MPGHAGGEKYFGLLLENSPDALVFFDGEGRFVYCSGTFMKLMGQEDYEAVIGRKFSDVYKNFADEKFLEETQERFKRVIAGHKTFTAGVQIDFSGKGQFRTYSINSTPMMNDEGTCDGALVIYSDITDLPRTEEDERTRIMLDATPLACTFWDGNGQLIDCNEEALHLFKVKSKEEFCRRFDEFSSALQADGSLSSVRIRENYWEAREKGRLKFNWLHRASDGEWLPCSVTLVRVSFRDGLHVVGYTRDLRDVQVLEDKQRESDERARELEVQTRAAQVANESKSRFLASMSHEIRTPMNAIIGMSDLMRTDNLDETQKNYFADIKKMSRTLLQIINDILDISKIEAGKMDLIPVHFSLSELCDNLCSLNRFTAEAKDLEFRYSFSPDLPHFVYGDDVRIRQVITNILNNAIKYTREGFVEFNVSRVPADDCGLHGVKESLVFSVKDSGIGIKKEDFPKLFGNFEQLDERANRGIVGTGLGLAITRNLVSMMKGRIDFSSEYGKGSVFTVYLPLVEGDPQKVERKMMSSRVIASDNAKVLVVDDNLINLRVALAFLSTHNIHAETAESGAEAVAMAAEKKWDIIFMDHMMPGMNGVEATRIIREWDKTVPIVALTANAVSGVREQFLEAGMNDMVAKPIDAVELNMKLTKWLGPGCIAGFEDASPHNPKPADKAPARAGTAGLETASAGRSEAVLDKKDGLDRCGGDRELYEKLCDSFVEDHGGDYEKIKTAFDTGDIPLAHRLSHTLKSTAALLGGGKTSAIAREMEAFLAPQPDQGQNTVNAPDKGAVQGLLDELGTALKEFLDELLNAHKALAGPRQRMEGIMDDTGKFSILTVDDERSNLLVLDAILSPVYRVFSAKSGEEMLSRVQEDPPDLILMDIIMPGMDGFEALKRLKENPDTRRIPVIIISGLDGEANEEKGFLCGAVDYITKPFKNTIVLARVNTHIQIVRQIRMIERLGLVDPLTDIPNRRCFDDRLDIEWRRAVRDKKPLSFMMMDVDKFKSYNDTYGHPQGDVLLKALARIFSSAARRPGDLAARLGGEEFGVLLPDTAMEAALEIAEEIRARVEAVRVAAADGKTETRTTISIGVVCEIPTADTIPRDFISQADKRLYAAKEGGRNRVCSR